jgi:hypothetical protein
VPLSRPSDARCIRGGRFQLQIMPLGARSKPPKVAADQVLYVAVPNRGLSRATRADRRWAFYAAFDEPMGICSSVTLREGSSASQSW